MDGSDVVEQAGAILPLAARPSTRPSTVQGPGWEHPCDDVRQLVVVVWARAKLLERLLSGQAGLDSAVLTGLAEIGAAIGGISARLDEMEDALAKRVA